MSGSFFSSLTSACKKIMKPPVIAGGLVTGMIATAFWLQSLSDGSSRGTTTSNDIRVMGQAGNSTGGSNVDADSSVATFFGLFALVVIFAIRRLRNGMRHEIAEDVSDNNYYVPPNVTNVVSGTVVSGSIEDTHPRTTSASSFAGDVKVPGPG